jgi:hypothetical protein
MIFAHDPLILTNGKQVNVIFQNGDKLISICCDDSCGQLRKLSRSDLRLVDGDNDVTDCIFDNPDLVVANLDNFARAFAWLNKA